MKNKYESNTMDDWTTKGRNVYSNSRQCDMITEKLNQMKLNRSNVQWNTAYDINYEMTLIVCRSVFNAIYLTNYEWITTWMIVLIKKNTQRKYDNFERKSLLIFEHKHRRIIFNWII